MKPAAKRLTSLIAVLASMVVCTKGWCSPPPSQTNNPVIVAGGSKTTVMPRVASSQTNNPVIVAGGSKTVMPRSDQYPTDRAFIEAIQKLIPANGEPTTWVVQPENIYLTEKQWQVFLADNLRIAKEASDYRKKAGLPPLNGHNIRTNVSTNDGARMLDVLPPAIDCITNMYLVNDAGGVDLWSWGFGSINGGNLIQNPENERWYGDVLMVGGTCTNYNGAAGIMLDYDYQNGTNCPSGQATLGLAVAQFSGTDGCCTHDISYVIKNPSSVSCFSVVLTLPECDTEPCFSNETNCIQQIRQGGG